jgi:hypothetical protein
MRGRFVFFQTVEKSGSSDVERAIQLPLVSPIVRFPIYGLANRVRGELVFLTSV